MYGSSVGKPEYVHQIKKFQRCRYADQLCEFKTKLYSGTGTCEVFILFQMFSGSGNQGMVQPAKEKGVDSKQDELDNLAKKVQSILNKVTAKNFSF